MTESRIDASRKLFNSNAKCEQDRTLISKEDIDGILRMKRAGKVVFSVVLETHIEARHFNKNLQLVRPRNFLWLCL